MIWAALRLLEATGETRYLDHARRWLEVLDRHYWDETAGGYFTAADDTRDVIVRLRTATDDATPSANAVMVSNLALLSLLTGDTRHHARAERIVRAFSADLARNLAAHTGLLAAAFDILVPQLIVIASETPADGHALLRALYSRSVPGAAEIRSFAAAPAAAAQLAVLEDKSPLGSQPAAYVCLGPTCALPVSTPEALRSQIDVSRATS